jgi:AcrR family transcriptional regulator
MWALFQEKPFDAITVQELLDRAGVARSTFYTYFRDKNDLFVTDVDEFLERTATGLVGRADAGDRVAPVRELFSHIGEMRKLYVAFVASGRIHEFFDLTRAHFTRGIEARLGGTAAGRQAYVPTASSACARVRRSVGVATVVVDRRRMRHDARRDGRPIPRDGLVGSGQVAGPPNGCRGHVSAESH